jgi:uncharacterized PurR-regulated membrane protein YhhQ (DUF165 family)
MTDLRKIAAAAAFAACIPAANWLIGNVGTTCVPAGPCLIPVAPGLMAPSGVLMIGLALVLRDAAHEAGGARLAALCILIGAALSLVFSPPALAVASAVAFLVAEMLDLAVYTPLRRRNRAVAVAASGVAGAIADSMLFVWLAFGSLDLSAGTALAKLYASAAVALWIFARSRRAAA